MLYSLARLAGSPRSHYTHTFPLCAFGYSSLVLFPFSPFWTPHFALCVVCVFIYLFLQLTFGRSAVICMSKRLVIDVVTKGRAMSISPAVQRRLSIYLFFWECIGFRTLASSPIPGLYLLRFQSPFSQASIPTRFLKSRSAPPFSPTPVTPSDCTRRCAMTQPRKICCSVCDPILHDTHRAVYGW